MTGSQRPRALQEVKLNEELRKQKIYSVSWNDNFILVHKPNSYLLTVYDCTTMHSFGEMKTSIQLGCPHFIAACPLPVDMEKPEIEQFVIIECVIPSSVCLSIWQKEEKEFKFKKRSFILKVSIIEKNLPDFLSFKEAYYAFMMPCTNILGFVYAKHCILIDIEKEEIIALLPVPRDLHKFESAFVAPNYLVFPDYLTSKLRAYQISRTKLKEKCATHEPNLLNDIWAWQNGNFLAAGTKEGVVFYKLEPQSTGFLGFSQMARLSVPRLFDAKIIRNEFVLCCCQVTNWVVCESGLYGYNPLTARTRSIVDARVGYFFSTCLGIVFCANESTVASLFPFASIPFSPPTKEPYSKEKFSDALNKALNGSRIPSSVIKLIGSYASSQTSFFNPVRKLISSERLKETILKKYIEKVSDHQSENKGDAKQSESQDQIVKGVKRLLDLFETSLLRFDCVEQALKESKALKDLVETSMWNMSSLNPADKQLVNTIRELRDSDDPRPWHKKIF